MTVLEWLLQVAGDLATLVIYVTIGVAAYSFWRRTLGRRRALADIVTSLTPMMQVDYFIHRLGTPAFRGRTDVAEDFVWVHPDAFVRALAQEGTVLVYAITTRTKRFAPTFMRGHVISTDGDSLEIELGRTKFGDLPGSPEMIRGDVGARRWGYSEYYYFGNPGAYQTYGYALSDAGWFPPQSDRLMNALVAHPDVDATRPTNGTGIDSQLHEDVAESRTHAVFNTFAVIAPSWLESNDTTGLGFTPGADNDLVRLARYMRGLTPLEVRRLRSRSRQARN